MEEPSWLKPEAWVRAAEPPADGRAYVRLVVDDDLGTIAELTDQNGNHFYGVDAPRR